MDPVLTLTGINVTFSTPDGEVEAVRGVNLVVGAGETVAVVGESGSGKSQLMMAMMGLTARNGRVTGSARYRGTELIGLPRAQLNKVRGAKITMIFQEPMTSLDPLFRVGDQIAETLRTHAGLSRRASRAKTVELMRLVQLPEPERRIRAYPHELSGGQRQRVMIAMALANDPDVLIADEPTTALDVTIQADILALLASLQKRLGMAIVLITHDLSIVEAFADRVAVMRYGLVVETGTTRDVFAAPREDYTRTLLASEPTGRKPPLPSSRPAILAAEDISVRFGTRGLLRRGHVIDAVRKVSLGLREGETLGIVGESGSGKSTLGRVLVHLQAATGRVVYRGTEISALDRAAVRPFRRDLQIVFQDPFGSLSPRMTVGAIVAEGLLVHEPRMSRAERTRRAADTLAEVGLEPAHRNRFPHEFSGGQRQRIAIARAIILRPKLIVLDEPTSALDRSVQRGIVALLRRLQDEHGLAYVFISHDLAVVRAMADHVMVMQAGGVVEEGPTDDIFAAPKTEYTRRLLAAAFDLAAILRQRSIEPAGDLSAAPAPTPANL